MNTKRVKFAEVPIGRMFCSQHFLWIRMERTWAVTIPTTACGACAFLTEVAPFEYKPADDKCEFVDLLDETEVANVLYEKFRVPITKDLTTGADL